MARARINKDGDKVILKLSFREAAALRALLAKVGPETNEAINEAVEGAYFELDRMMDDVSAESTKLWPLDYEGFINGDALVDPGVPQQLPIPLVSPVPRPPPARHLDVDLEEMPEHLEYQGLKPLEGWGG